jgi:NADH:ubiquinone oxidoreductase subunit K
MNRIVLLLAAVLFVLGIHPVSAQQNEIAVLRAEIAKQQVVIAQLLNRIEALETQTPPAAAPLQNLQDDIKAQED